MDPGDFESLLTPAGQRLLAAAVVGYDEPETDALALSTRLRRLADDVPARQRAGLVAAALTQAALRRRGVAKFGPLAARLYFTSSGLEQATHPVVAAHRAARLGAVHSGAVLDLGCGIGSDLLSYAAAGFEPTGVERDPLTARVAGANLAACELAGQVRVGRAEDAELGAGRAVFVDPGRRTGDGRVFDPRAYSPPWDFVVELLTTVGNSASPRVAVAKLAPGLDHALIPATVEAEWVSLDGELKEVALWAPRPDAAVTRRATVLAAGRPAQMLTAGPADEESPPVADVGGVLYEPGPAVIRAHLVAQVVTAVDGWLLDPNIAYVSSDRAVVTPFARAFRVVERLPYREKALRAALRERHIGSLTIKKRGVAVTPEELRRRLALKGTESATLLLTRTPGSAVALLVEPIY